MSCKINEMKITVEKRVYWLFIIPLVSYARSDDISVVNFLGLPIYCRVGEKKSLFGFRIR